MLPLPLALFPAWRTIEAQRGLELRATQLLTPGMGLQLATQVALSLYTGYNVAVTLASVPAGRFSERQGAVRVLAVGVLLFLFAYLGIAVSAPSLAVLTLGFLYLAVWMVVALLVLVRIVMHRPERGTS